MPEPAGKPSEQPETEIEADVDMAIEACGGDIRAALRATLIANTFLDAEVDRLTSLASAGYARGRLRKKQVAGDGAKTAD